MKKSIKKFFKPNRSKILLCLILIAINLPLSLFYSLSSYKLEHPIPAPGGCSTFGIGFPAPFLEYDSCLSYFGEPFYKSIGFMDSSLLSASLALIIDLIFWYLISCLVIFIFSKLRKKNKIPKIPSV